MKKKPNIKLSSREIIIDLGNMQEYAKSLLNEEKKYKPLLKYLLNSEFFNDEDTSIPSLQKIAENAGMEYAKVRKYLYEIYEDLVLEKEEILIEFKEVEYWFNARSYKGDISFCIPNLNVVPRVGEEVQLTSFQALLGNTQFYVSSITHRFESGKQVIAVFLDQGFYNKYWHFRKDKAVEEGEITSDDYYLKQDVLIKQKLGISRY